MKDIRSRLESKFIPEPNTGCFLWIAGCNEDGYGKIWYNGRPDFAHRVVYEVFVGPIPVGLFILHRCDTPACVNPDHLFPGTHQENMADAKRKGRTRPGFGPQAGENNYAARLMREDVLAIRESNLLQREIAESYNVTQSMVSRIKNRRAWRHI